ncbi:hypothetical protein ACQ4M4_10935 [Leptolyngbya sp. AN02str]|uniref:hypothetical protein n=1 Tax=Leptolyngbya sp. AN02str TaxID=3423363 RepID=UPI003D31C635
MNPEDNEKEFAQKLLEATNDHEILQIIDKAWISSLRKGKDRTFAEELIQLHNSKQIDLVHVFSTLENRANSDIRFFSVRNIFEELLPNLNAEMSQVMDCVLHLVAQAGQDLTACILFRPFIEYCSAETTRPKQGLRLIEDSADKYKPFLVSVLTAGSQADFEHYFHEAIRLVNDKDIGIRREAVCSLGSLRYPEDLYYVDEAFQVLESAVNKEADDILLASAVKVAFDLYQRNNLLTDRATQLVDSALLKGGDTALWAASRLFGFDCKDLPESLVDVLLKHLLRVNPNHKGTLDNIDYGVNHLFSSGAYEKGLKFIERMLSSHKEAISLKVFDSTSHNLIQNKNNILGRIVTRWFLQGKQELCEGIVSILEVVHGHELLISLEQEELEELESEAIIFVARKSIGYLFFQPVSAASVIISLMSFTSNDKTIQTLSSLLFDPLLINYSGKVGDYLKAQLETHVNTHVRQGVQRAIESFESYIEDLKSIGDIPELHPSQENREVYRRRMTRQMSEAMKNAEKESVFLSIITKSILLYGRKSIDYVYGPDGESRRMEMPLKSFGTEMEFPRLDNIDPFGLDYMIRIFRAEQRRANEADN